MRLGRRTGIVGVDRAALLIYVLMCCVGEEEMIVTMIKEALPDRRK